MRARFLGDASFSSLNQFQHSVSTANEFINIFIDRFTIFGMITEVSNVPKSLNFPPLDNVDDPGGLQMFVVVSN